MSDDWTPIEKAGKYGGPIILIDREPIIRRLQDGLIASRAKLAVIVHRPKIYADTSHIEDQLASGIAGLSFQWGDPVEERESDIELPAAYWASDKLGNTWRDLWHNGDARLESADGNERASFYGLQLLELDSGNARRDVEVCRVEFLNAFPPRGTVGKPKVFVTNAPEPPTHRVRGTGGFPLSSERIPPERKSGKGRAKGTGYQRADALLLDKMREAIANNPALNATSAAKLVASEAEGASFEAKVDRLARAFRAGRNGE